MSQRLTAVFTPFENLTDPRVNRTLRHELFDVVVLALCATIAGSDSWRDIERFGKRRLPWLRTFLALENGVPSHNTFGRVFAALDPAGLVNCVQLWIEEIGREAGEHIAIDGKTLRGSFDKAAGKNPLHLVSAWASESRLMLGQVAVDSKSNEITAIPLLLKLLDLKDATVTIDAMGCQKEIAEAIVEGGGDYLLSLKDNHPTLGAAAAEELIDALGGESPPAGMRKHTTVEVNGEREERREYIAMPAPKSLPGFADWVGLATLVMVVRTTKIGDVEKGEVRYFLSSLPAKVKKLAKLIRAHWSIENQLHWVLDVNFSEDASRIRKGQAPQTAAVLRKLAVSILSSDTTLNDNLRGKRYQASLSTDVLERILLGFSRK